MAIGKKAFVPRIRHKYIGTYHPRADAIQKASGTAVYSDDMTMKRRYPDMLYMKILKSPYAHGRIVSLDTSAAVAVPGVVGLLRYDDPEIAQLKMTSAAWTDATATQDQKRSWGSGTLDRKVLGDEAHWVGDELGVAIAAETLEAAEEAMRLVKVQWEILPFALTIEDAIKPDAPLMHPQLNPDNNFLPYYDFSGPDTFVDRGDVDKAFAEADVVVEGRMEYGNPQQCALDYWTCMMDWRQEQLTVLSNSYAVDQTRMHIHDMLGLPLSFIRVISPFEGGQHGRSDNGDQPFFIITALMSKKTGRPVKYRQCRKEHFHDTRTNSLCTIKMGAMKDGSIIAMETMVYGNQGAYADLGIAEIKFVPKEWAELTPGRIPNLRMTAKGVYTNIIPSSCMRSIGNAEMNYFMGLGLDMLAEKLDMDPVELAIKNISCHNVPTPNPCVEQVIRAAEEEFGWGDRHKPGQGEWFDGCKKRGVGFSVNNTWHTENHEFRRGPTQVMIKLNPDGTVILDAPTVEVGTGSNNCAVIACAEALGVAPDKIRWIAHQDTETGLKDQVQTDSAVSYILSEAVHQCALDLKGQFLALVAKKMNRCVDELDMCEGRVFVKASPSVSMTITEYYDSIDLFEEGNLVPLTCFYARPLSMEDFGTAYQAAFAEVEVDTETGKVEVLRFVIACDGGTVLYPPGAEGQLIGGQCMGLGEALYETMIYDDATGIPLNFNFIDYKFPTIADFPDIVAIPMEVYRGRGEYGCSGMGEGAPCCTPRAIANAVYNAIGVRINESPITPVKVLEALGKDGE